MSVLHTAHPALPFATASFADHNQRAPTLFTDTRVVTNLTEDPFKDAVLIKSRKTKKKDSPPSSDSRTIAWSLLLEPAEIMAPPPSIHQRLASIASTNGIASAAENDRLIFDALTLGSLPMSPLERSARGCANPAHGDICVNIAHWTPTSDGTLVRATCGGCNIVRSPPHARAASGNSITSFLLLTPAELLRSTYFDREDTSDSEDADDVATMDHYLGQEGIKNNDVSHDGALVLNMPPKKTMITRFVALHGTGTDSPYVPGRFLRIEHVPRQQAPPSSPLHLQLHQPEDDSFKNSFDRFTRYITTICAANAPEVELDLDYVNWKLELFLCEMETA